MHVAILKRRYTLKHMFWPYLTWRRVASHGSERERAPPSIIMCIRNYMHLLASSNCTPFYFIQTSRMWRERADSERKKKKTRNLNYCYVVCFFELATVIIMRCIPFCWQTNITFYFRFNSLFSFSFKNLTFFLRSVRFALTRCVVTCTSSFPFEWFSNKQKLYFSPYSLVSSILLIATTRRWMNPTAMHA